MRHIIEARAVRLGYGDKIIAHHIDLKIDKPEIISIIGPNGSGKSTLLKALSRLLKPVAGAVLLDGQDLYRLPPGQVARIVAVLPQATHAPAEMTVYDLVACGRYPYRRLFETLKDADKQIISEAIAATGLSEMAHRRLEELSGGERQRAWLAMTIAQQPKILMLDEPTTYLDIHHQLELMSLVRKLHQQLQLTVVMVLHDLNHAARFSHRIIALRKGEVFADGTVQQVFTQDNLRSIYGVETKIMTMQQGENEHLVCFPHDVCIPCGA